MRVPFLFLLGFLAFVPAPQLLANKKAPPRRSTTPACTLQCPPGFAVVAYSFELHAAHTIFDETGKEFVPPDGIYRVSCGLRCEQHAVNVETKIWTDKKVVCDSGGEPAPYSGPWRITGPFSRECDSRTNNGCSMHCYEIPKPVQKGKGKGKGGKK